MNAWKQVDAKDAHFIESGSLKLGTWEDYRRLENGRGDPYDAGVVVHSGAFMNRDPRAAAALTRMGRSPQDVAFLTGPNVDAAFMGNRTIFTARPLNALCLSKVGCKHDPSPDEPKATFEIDDVHALARRIAEIHADEVWGFDVKPVAYRDVEYEALQAQPIPDPDPFVKGRKFEVEQEIRIIFPPTKQRKSEWELKTLYTRPDPIVAAMFRRVDLSS